MAPNFCIYVHTALWDMGEGGMVKNAACSSNPADLRNPLTLRIANESPHTLTRYGTEYQIKTKLCTYIRRYLSNQNYNQPRT